MAKNNHARISCWLRPAAAILGVICILSLSSVHAFSSSHYRQMAQLPSHRRTGGPSVGRTHHQNSLLRRNAATIDIQENAIGYDPLETANGIEPETKSLTESLTFYVRFVLERLAKNRLDKKIKNYKKGRRRAMWKSLNEQRKNLIALAGYTHHIVVPSFGFLFLGALMASITPHYYSTCIQLVSTLSGSKQELIKAVLGLGIVSILEALFTGLRGSLFWIGGSRANYNVRVKLHRSLLLQEAAFFDMNETGYLLSRLNSDVNKIGQVISYHVNVVLRQLAQCVFGSIYLFKIAPKLSMWTFAGIGVVGYVSALYGNFSRYLAEKVQDTFADATAVAETSFSMSETIRAFDGVEIESGKFGEAQGKALDLEEVQAWAYGTHKFVSDVLQSILQVALLAACWGVGRAGGLPASQLTTFMFYTNFVLESSNEVGDQWAKIQSAVGASTSVFELIKRVPSIRDPPTSEAIGGVKAPSVKTIRTSSETDSLVRVNGDDKAKLPIISIQNMTVTYGAMENAALSQVDLDIYRGDRVAIVGRSGSGKSSMLRTILRFYDPSTGSISLDGLPLTGMSRSEISSKISVVEQEPHLFPTTLIENVLYGIDKDETDAETGELQYSESYRRAVTDSLSLAGLNIRPGNDLGLGLDTRVGEGGRSLSGGQRQRVAIARAVIRSPRVLLLDEPTAALDSQSEKKVVAALQHSMEYTNCMVMVTHRLGVIRALNVNRVVVLEQGKIVENGHPEDLLLNDDSLYAALAREQGITANNQFMRVPSQNTTSTVM